MYWLSILSTAILLLFAYCYFQSGRKLKIRKGKLDWEGKNHKLVDISENLVDHCSKAKKCLVCGLTVHKICVRMKGAPKQPCKKMITEELKEIGKEGLHEHAWVVRKANFEVKCLVCNNPCNNLSQIVTHRCLWCNKFRHDFCKDETVCDFGRFQKISLKPSEIKGIKSGRSNSEITFEISLKTPRCIPVFIINKLSGAQFGEDCLEYLYYHLNPFQVIDLLDEGIERLEYFKNLKDVMVVVGGGDGTMGGLVDPIHKILGKDTNLIPFALGTGNDLSRAMGWGEGIKSIYDIKYFLKGLENKPMKTLLDRWRIKITSKSNPAKVLLDEKMLLYFGIGLDAKFSYRFNMIRKKYPVFFKSTLFNKFFYSQLGTFNLFTEKKLEMNKALKIRALDSSGKIVDVKVEETSENILVQNTHYWAGGCYDVWDSSLDEPSDNISVTSQDSYREQAGPKQTVQSKPQTHTDGLCEMMSFKSLFHMGRIQVGLSKADRVYQSSHYFIEYNEKSPLYVHVDGEGYLISEKCFIEISNVDQILMNISKVKTPSSRYLGDILDVLSKSADEEVITKEQRDLLYQKFVKNL